MEISKPRIHIEVTATITITSEEARVLDHLTSYSLVEWFAKNCNSREIPEKTINSTLSSLRSQIARVMHAHRIATEGVNEAIKSDK